MKNAAAKQPTSLPGLPPTYRSCSIGMGTGELTQGTYEVAKQPPKIGDKIITPLPSHKASYSRGCIILGQSY